MAPVIGRKVAKGPAKKKALTFTIDCSKPVEDKIMEVRRLVCGPAYQPWVVMCSVHGCMGLRACTCTARRTRAAPLFAAAAV